MGVCLSAGFLAVNSGSRTCVFWHPSASKQQRELVLNMLQTDRFPRVRTADGSNDPSKTFEGVSCKNSPAGGKPQYIHVPSCVLAKGVEFGGCRNGERHICPHRYHPLVGLSASISERDPLIGFGNI